MKVLHVDAYRYNSDKAIRFTNSKGTIQLNKGTIFYYITTDREAEGFYYISLLPKGPYFKLSEQSFNKVSDRADEFLFDADVTFVKPSDDSKRSYEYATDYQVILLKHKPFIFTNLKNILKSVLPKNTEIKSLNTLSTVMVAGELGVTAKVKSVEHKLNFTLGINPFFSYSIWFPKDVKADDKINRNKVVKDCQQNIFKKLRLKLNTIKKGKSIVHLPGKPFSGTILRSTTKI